MYNQQPAPTSSNQPQPQPVPSSSNNQELVAAKTRLETWREADGQLLEALSLRKTATLGAGTAHGDGMDQNLLLHILLHILLYHMIGDQ